MTSLSGIASGIATYIGNELEFDTEHRDNVRYGLEIVLGTLIKVIVILTVASVFGLTAFVCALFATSITMRLLSGGAHFRTYWRCLNFSVVTSISIVLAAQVLAPHLNRLALILAVFLFAGYSYYVIDRFAPADNPAKPIKGIKKQLRYKRLSKIFVVGWCACVVLCARLFPSPTATILLLASMGGFVLQTISILPFSYGLAGLADDFIDSRRASRR
jgi:accessory gene regulator B